MAAIATTRPLASSVMEDDGNNSCCSDDTVLSVGTEEAACENLSFKNIESHLNAISQMTAASEESTKSPPSPALSPSSSSQSPSPSCCFRASPSFFCTAQNNNETNGTSLKFSIDNILKADFGRRITEPMNVRKARVPRKTTAEEPTGKPVDLSKAEAENRSNNSKGSSAEPAGQQQPMLWPAWVYCTRYSDRPSSGECFFRFFLFDLDEKD